MSKSINKILVVGAGVAGLTVCYWLKKLGFLPTLIEKSSMIRVGGHALDIRGVAISVVKKMDIYNKIYDMRTRIEKGYYVDYNGNTLVEEAGDKFRFKQTDDVEIIRGNLIKILMEATKNIPCQFNRSVEHIIQYDDRVEVTFNNHKSENYDLVIGTDGLHSSIRNLVFNKSDYNLIDLGSYISICEVPNYLNLHKSETLFELNQKSIYVSSTNNDKLARVGFMFRSIEKLNDIRDEQEQKNFLQKNFFNLGWEANKLLELMDKSEEFYFDAIMQVKMKNWSKGRVVLVGDAGYCASPLSGQGTSTLR